METSKKQILDQLKAAYKNAGYTEKEINMYVLGFEQGVSFYAGLIEGCLKAATEVAQPIDFSQPAQEPVQEGTTDNDTYRCAHVDPTLD